ncbi:alpha-2-macroglobulin-like protein 1 [Pelobates fuscus]|uniref:alpha-2-macroglobulin-like protein 1 n=1 Tax=Pelobates fuscus TaxID=191477 RepID=UPI002FE441AA
MNFILLSFCVSVLGLRSVITSEPHYVITVPAQMLHSSIERACVTFLSLRGALNVQLEIQRGDQVHLVAKDKIRGPNYSQCYEFQVPVVKEKQVWFFHLLAQGEDININQTKKILISKTNHVTFIQTDKPLYKPGQTVNFRVVTLDKNFSASEEKYPLVELLDPKRNRIGQWLNISPVHGIADFTFPLAEELPLGQYKISIPTLSVKSFSVSEYVLKRFEVNINLPSTVAQTDKQFTLEACGRYNYGKPVLGSININVCLQTTNLWPDYFAENKEDTDSENCQEILGEETDSRGCISKNIDLTFFNLSNPEFEQYLEISCVLSEFITGQVEKATAKISIASQLVIEFVNIRRYYQKGLPFNGMMKVEDRNGELKPNETVFLVTNINDVDYNLRLLTNGLGIAHFTLDTTEWENMVTLQGKFSLDESDELGSKIDAFTWLDPFYSESNSFLKIEAIASKLECGTKQPIQVNYALNKMELDPNSEHLSFFYLILAKGGIYYQEEYKLNVLEQKKEPILQGSFYLEIPVTDNMIPEISLLVFTVFMDGEVAADRATYTISTCFKNKVELKFSEKKIRPGRKVNLEVKAESGSMCSVRSVDKGLLLHQPHERTLSSTLNEITSWIAKVTNHGVPYIIEDIEEYYCMEPEDQSILDKTQKKSVWYPSDPDVYSLFKISALKVFTNTKIRKPVSCVVPMFNPRSSFRTMVKSEVTDLSDPSLSEEDSERQRIHFPDTWLYELVSIGPKGHALLNLTTPDSITSWVTDAFCLGKSGFGETHDVELTTFKPYFIDLNLPYSVIQGEEVTLSAHVFSYQKYCSMVVVSLLDSPDFTSTESMKKQFRCICADQTASFTWNITATKIGTTKIQVRSYATKQDGECTQNDLDQKKRLRSDSLAKSIIVKPRGILQEHTETTLLCPSDTTVQEELYVQIPAGWVQGSEFAHITVLGDIMGNAISNIGHSLRLPTGCGEQNMALFAPNIYIMQYLQSTNQLTPELSKQTLAYLTTGYQRQLMFKHDDGSYSAFGNKDMEGNTWLTAFVLRSFSQAREFIYVEEKHIHDAVKWLSSLQMQSGCFQSVGYLFNNQLKSEVSDEVTFAAYITIALLESGAAYNESIVHDSLRCLKNQAHNVTSIYSQALLAYAFTLSGDNDLRYRMLKGLEKKAITKGGNMHWALDSTDGGVEISSYVLLAFLSDKTASIKDIAGASHIVSWVIKQQNPRGGFSSTQDTVVALQALSKYAKATFIESGYAKIRIRSHPGFQKQLIVDKSKSLLMQKVVLPYIPGKYTVTATGKGCVYVQTYLKYHIPTSKTDTHFILSVNTQPTVCTSHVGRSFEILVEVRYTGNRISSNMVIVEVELLSGFISIEESVKKLEKNPLIKRTEVTAEKVIIYLEELKHQTEEFSFFVKQETLVKNLQPANVRVYDYYDPGEHSEAEYTAPCSSGSDKQGAQ